MSIKSAHISPVFQMHRKSGKHFYGHRKAVSGSLSCGPCWSLHHLIPFHCPGGPVSPLPPFLSSPFSCSSILFFLFNPFVFNKKYIIMGVISLIPNHSGVILDCPVWRNKSLGLTLRPHFIFYQLLSERKPCGVLY